MEKNVLRSNLQQLMMLHGNLSVSEVARASQVPQPTLHHILMGSTKKPRKQALEALANFFKVTVKQICGEEALPLNLPETLKDSLGIKTIPVIAWSSLPNWLEQEALSQPHQEILLDRSVSAGSFALFVENDSFLPAFPKDTLLIFDPEKAPKDRGYILVHMAKANTVLFNRYFIDGNEHYIKQQLENDHAQLLSIDFKQDRLLGTLAEVRLHF